MKGSERRERGLSDESDCCFLAEMCPDVTTVGSFHQGLGVKGRRRCGCVFGVYSGVDTTGACDTDFKIHLFLLNLKFLTLLLFHLGLHPRLRVCAPVCMH